MIDYDVSWWKRLFTEQLKVCEGNGCIWEHVHINPGFHAFSPCADSKKWSGIDFLGSPAVVPSVIQGSLCPWEKAGVSKANDCGSTQQPTEAQTSYNCPQYCRQVRVFREFEEWQRSSFLAFCSFTGNCFFWLQVMDSCQLLEDILEVLSGEFKYAE